MNARTCEWYEDGCLLEHHGGKPTQQNCDECSDYQGPNRGMGDHVKRVIDLTGLDRLKPKSRDCGCGKRRSVLNNAFPSKGK